MIDYRIRKSGKLATAVFVDVEAKMRTGLLERRETIQLDSVPYDENGQGLSEAASGLCARQVKYRQSVR